MPSGAVAKRLLLAAGLGLLVLLVVGFIFGAVGSAMFGTNQLLTSRRFTWLHSPFSRRRLGTRPWD